MDFPSTVRRALHTHLSATYPGMSGPDEAGTWIARQKEKFKCDFIEIEPRTTGVSEIYWHEDEDKSVRLIKATLTEALDLSLTDTARNRSKKVKVCTMWLDAWAGPPIQPPTAKLNTFFDHDVKLLSLRPHGYFNFMGIMILDLRRFCATADDNSMLGLFKPNAPRFVRVRFTSGKYLEKFMYFTVTVVDTGALENPDHSELSNIMQTKFVSCLLLGDRVRMLRTGACGVVVALRKEVASVGLSAAEESFVTISFDKNDVPDQEFTVSVDRELPFLLVCTEYEVSFLFPCSDR